MVKKKGLGYSIEAIVAIATVFIFIFGAVNVPQGQDWNSFRSQVSANDLTYTLQEAGYINHALRNGETGSIQTAFSTITERDVEVSGLVSNLPINDNRVAFHVVNSDRYNQNLDEVESSDKCEGDLEEIKSRSDQPVLRSEGGLENNRLYIGDLDPQISGGNSEQDYDSVWVDNGTKCQFSNSEGPFNIEEIFKWDNNYYDIKSIESDKLRIYNATQPVRFRDMFDRDVNSVKTFTSVDTVNFTRLDRRSYDTAVIRREEAVQEIDTDTDKREKFENFLKQGSALILANLSSSSFENGDFLDDTGFEYVDVSYQGSYDGDSAESGFDSSTSAQEAQTSFLGLEGEEDNLEMAPSTKVISDTERTLESGKALVKSSKLYDFSEWNREKQNMNSVTPEEVEGKPDSKCLDNKPEALTEAVFDFPDFDYNVLNAELGTSDSYCNNNNVRAVKVDLDRDGDYLDENEGPFLNGDQITIDNRVYNLNITVYDPDPNIGCDQEGGCVSFEYRGDEKVEVIPRRRSLKNLPSGGKIALTSYRQNYDAESLKAIVSTIYWLRGSQTSFTGQKTPGETSTKTYSSIKEETYLPYEINFRWGQ
ncbi:hypothetical protein [Candidatus Nanohalobium constans]|uniref:Uncharacterized protein n=1 Tax=Candidatus Nanohalobium constans TaxID=2565781 RepID=A0A5Q0UH24_9ARCH|nr:hypothetical protein [Candidatus Nanohalobium constans]QGA80255.1 hypothetical protein LC1Nh_0354 [Candidatus Nanohalobium constans]